MGGSQGKSSFADMVRKSIRTLTGANLILVGSSSHGSAKTLTGANQMSVGSHLARGLASMPNR